MMSSLPKLADRAFALGELLPSLLFGIAILFLFQDQPLAKAVIAAISNKELGLAVYFLLAAWVMAIVLLVLNQPLYRLLEGYTLPRRLGEYLKDRHRQRFQATAAKIKVLHDKWVQSDPTVDRNEYVKLRLKQVKWMPSDGGEVLPTRFGNAVRAFEVYPRDIYGADGVEIWPRLVTVIPKSFAEQIQDTRTQVDFLVNACMFAAIIGLLAFCRALESATWHEFGLFTFTGICRFFFSIDRTWLVWMLAGFAASVLFYRWAVTRVPAWGSLVKTAFDCFLPKLASQLGFELPVTEAERRLFWTTLSQQLIYGRGNCPDRC